MSSRLEKLLFSVSLIDKASGPAGKIASQIDQLNQRATAGFTQVGVGAAGLFATGYALKSLLGPAIEMDRALGEVSSLGVRDAALQKLEKTALKFSVKYGESATEFVRASYDIQSAISGLNGSELSTFSETGGILAKATKSNVATITDYMGTMYGIFEKEAKRMGNANWVQRLAEQTSTAVAVFKTDGNKMASGFSALGADATAAGISMTEQMAILGSLQATMSGSESGTKYRAFLKGVGKAQDQLGLQFTDSHGRMLPMLDILQKLRGRYGETITVAEGMELQKAFGTQEAVALINQLLPKTEELRGKMAELENVQGMTNATKMAQKMVDPWQKMGASATAVHTQFGRMIQPVLLPVLEMMVSTGEAVMAWMDNHKTLSKVIGAGTLVIFGLVAAVSAFALVQGLATLSMAGWSGALLVSAAGARLWRFALGAAQATWFLFQMAVYGGVAIFRALRTAFMASTAATWLLNAALLANPITWIVLAVVALVAAVVGLIVYWDELMTWFSDIKPLQLLGKALDWLIDKINRIPGVDIGGGGEVTVTEKIEQEREAMNQASAGIAQTRPSAVPAGGLLKQVSQATTNNNGLRVDKIEVNTSGGVSGYQLADELALAGG
ncbi:phage tail tape measure protein [uncultured Microbulbifer sp.]|uniref:phage tail tape measure protein n=1 Tax=uncultured Microbulbifer sp. TaxID=348147 RepID=UPI00260BE7BD|nr:phage tail tape measure protein [uncultured Microbulbifer sp.]